MGVEKLDYLCNNKGDCKSHLTNSINTLTHSFII